MAKGAGKKMAPQQVGHKRSGNDRDCRAGALICGEKYQEYQHNAEYFIPLCGRAAAQLDIMVIYHAIYHKRSGGGDAERV